MMQRDDETKVNITSELMRKHARTERATSEDELRPMDARCANCGALLQGPWCHCCGQEAHDPLQRFRGAMSETLESVFHFDARLSRTLLPLLLRPGFLTCEYIAGRRVRYVAPLRLMFFLAILAFLVIRLSVEIATPQVHIGAQRAIAQASNAASVERLRAQLDSGLDQSLAQPNLPAWTRTVLLNKKSQIDRAAKSRLAQFPGHPVQAPAQSLPSHSHTNLKIDAAQSGVKGFPHAGSDFHERLYDNPRRALQESLVGAQSARRLMRTGLHLLPMAMLLLMPLFGLLLKLFFPRRPYTEHLLVALHSHAFVFLDLILIVLVGQLALWSGAFGPLATALGCVSVTVGWWAPIYLLLMQKRVYRQRWPHAVLSYVGIGMLYLLMLSAALAVVFRISRLH